MAELERRDLHGVDPEPRRLPSREKEGNVITGGQIRPPKEAREREELDFGTKNSFFRRTGTGSGEQRMVLVELENHG